MKDPIEVNLRTEIEFWLSLIDEWENTRNEPVNPRIEEALALAEYKLLQLASVNVKTKLH